jgi:uncharacterized membrane protein YjjP (DUF1212 family)
VVDRQRTTEQAKASAEAVAHCALQVGRILLQNGGDTGQVQRAIKRLADACGFEAHLLVTYEGLLLTLVGPDTFRTKVGSRIPAMNVGMSALVSVYDILDRIESGTMELPEAQAALDQLEHQPPAYNHVLVAAALGLTAASLSRLFGGDWSAFGVCWIAVTLATLLRQELGRRGLSPVLVAFAVACVSGLLGGLGARLLHSSTASLCLVASGMVIVPGVPLINGVQDMIRNHASTGVARIGFAFFVIAAIGLGLEVASAVSGVPLPLDAPSLPVPLAEDAVFSALAALGFAFLFSVPLRLAWACVLCGLCSHTVRSLCMHAGLDIVAGTLIGALVTGGMATVFARRLAAPAATFAFPGVVAMIPGVYGFRTVTGALRIVSAGPVPSAALVDATVGLGVTVVLMTAAIAIGIAVPLALGAPARMAVADITAETRR